MEEEYAEDVMFTPSPTTSKCTTDLIQASPSPLAISAPFILEKPNGVSGCQGRCWQNSESLISYPSTSAHEFYFLQSPKEGADGDAVLVCDGDYAVSIPGNPGQGSHGMTGDKKGPRRPSANCRTCRLILESWLCFYV